MRSFTKFASTVLLPAVLFLAGCGGAKPTEAPAAQTPAAQPAPAQQQPAATTPPPAAPGVVEVKVKLTDFQLDPKLITVPKGSKVKLTIVNEGEKKHDFKIEGVYKIESDLLSNGGSQTFEFVADQVGQFKIVCTQRGHVDKGMEGIFEVK